jgi:mono/diheme cytochrome c family protein
MKTPYLALLCVLSLAGASAYAEDAADIWRAKCKSCHGATGNGDTREGKKHKVPDMTTEAWQSKHSDAEIKEAIRDGVKDTKMKPFKDKYTEEEIDALVKYVRGLRK